MDEINQLILQLNDANPDVRKNAVCSLKTKINIQAVPTLISALDGVVSNQYWVDAVHCWIGNNNRKELDRLMNSLKLVTAYKHGDFTVRTDAAHAVWNLLDHDSTIPALIRALQNRNGIICEIAEEGLSIILENDLKRDASQALAKIGQPAILAVTNILKHENSHKKKCAARMLLKIGDKSAVPALIDALKDNCVRSIVIEALGKIGDKSAVPALFDALMDNDINLGRIARSLGNILNISERIEDVSEFEAQLQNGFKKMIKKDLNGNQNGRVKIQFAKLMKAAADKKNSLAPKYDIILDDIPKPPIRSTAYQQIRRKAFNV